jgi:hypothetical protein
MTKEEALVIIAAYENQYEKSQEIRELLKQAQYVIWQEAEAIRRSVKWPTG